MQEEIEKTHSNPEYSVSEISGKLKNIVEGNFANVRVRGEISGFKRAASGHLYFDLKDDKSVLNSVCWKGVAARIDCQPEDGLEVICSGKLTIYQGRSNYQLVVSGVEVAGAGALMALLEKRKKALAAEGLFADERKQELPFMPKTIGVVTSPTGAVIQDILHRIADRFPCEVLVSPVRVQGKGAEHEIARAIDGFNSLAEGGEIRKPDVIIVARGGGSLEDLWCFNEEVVVRAIADSFIPVISAVGHETDVTLADYAADKRAPTPTAAAEMAVPVLRELQNTIADYGVRKQKSISRLFEYHRQRLDESGDRLSRSLGHLVEIKRQRLAVRASGVRHEQLFARILSEQKYISQLYSRLHQAMRQVWKHKQLELSNSARMLASLNYHTILQRGFAIVLDNATNLPITSKRDVAKDSELRVKFHDGEIITAPKLS